MEKSGQLAEQNMADKIFSLNDADPSSPGTAPEHLNNSGLRIEHTEGKGRGVYGDYDSPCLFVVSADA